MENLRQRQQRQGQLVLDQMVPAERRNEVFRALLRYSWGQVKTYAELTAEEKACLTEMEFNVLRGWAFAGQVS